MYLPDHEFVVTAALVVVGIRGSEDIVGNIGTNAVTGLVVPLNVGGQALHVVDLDAPGELLASVGVALDVVLASRPLPLGGPAHARAGGALDGSALASGAGTLAPVVVVELVAIGCVVSVLFAEGCCLTTDWSNRGWASGGDGQKAGQGTSVEEHVDSSTKVIC
jgi:hypothetical protein